MKKTSTFLLVLFAMVSAGASASDWSLNYTGTAYTGRFFDDGLKLSGKPVLEQVLEFCHERSGLCADVFWATGFNDDFNNGPEDERDAEIYWSGNSGQLGLFAKVALYNIAPLSKTGSGDIVSFTSEVSHPVGPASLTVGVEYTHIIDVSGLPPVVEEPTLRDRYSNLQGRYAAFQADMATVRLSGIRGLLASRMNARATAWWEAKKASLFGGDAAPSLDDDGGYAYVDFSMPLFSRGPYALEGGAGVKYDHFPGTDDGLAGRFWLEGSRDIGRQQSLFAGAQFGGPLSSNLQDRPSSYVVGWLGYSVSWGL